MKPIRYVLAFFTSVFFLSCGGGDPAPTPEPVIKTPGKSSLVAPVNARTCEEGTNTTATQSTVAFSWNSASDTDSYEIKITNLNTSEVTTQTGITTTSTSTLSKNKKQSCNRCLAISRSSGAVRRSHVPKLFSSSWSS